MTVFAHDIGKHSPVELDTFIGLIEKHPGKKAIHRNMSMQPGDTPKPPPATAATSTAPPPRPPVIVLAPADLLLGLAFAAAAWIAAPAGSAWRWVAAGITLAEAGTWSTVWAIGSLLGQSAAPPSPGAAARIVFQ